MLILCLLYPFSNDVSQQQTTQNKKQLTNIKQQEKHQKADKSAPRHKKNENQLLPLSFALKTVL